MNASGRRARRRAPRCPGSPLARPGEPRHRTSGAACPRRMPGARGPCGCRRPRRAGPPSRGSPCSPSQSVQGSWTMRGVTPFQGTVAADGIMLTTSAGKGHVYPYAPDSIVQVVTGVREGRGLSEGPSVADGDREAAGPGPPTDGPVPPQAEEPVAGHHERQHRDRAGRHRHGPHEAGEPRPPAAPGRGAAGSGGPPPRRRRGRRRARVSGPSLIQDANRRSGSRAVVMRIAPSRPRRGNRRRGAARRAVVA